MVDEDIEEIRKQLDNLKTGFEKKSNPDDKELYNQVIKNSVVQMPGHDEDTLGKDLQVISKELTKDENVFRFGNSDRQNIYWEALLCAVMEKPNYNSEVLPRYEFLKYFRYHYHILRGSVKSGQAERYKEIAGSLLGFKSFLEYRKAGVREGDAENIGLIEKIKKGR